MADPVDGVTDLIRPLIARALPLTVVAVGAAFALFFLWPYLGAVFALQNQFKENLVATEANSKSLASAWDRISQIDQAEKSAEQRAGGLVFRFDHDDARARLEERIADFSRRLDRIEAVCR